MILRRVSIGLVALVAAGAGPSSSPSGRYEVVTVGGESGAGVAEG